MQMAVKRKEEEESLEGEQTERRVQAVRAGVEVGEGTAEAHDMAVETSTSAGAVPERGQASRGTQDGRNRRRRSRRHNTTHRMQEWA